MAVVYVTEHQLQQIENFYQMHREELYPYLLQHQGIELMLVEAEDGFDSEINIIYR